ncbi:MAG: exodeoxyribonuclease VII large subunit [Legionellales bacterium]|nr:exodeoxyribonuclease VII large subunit [Legionellales bacterium]|tara:strand:+ start:2253 stop:3584 length:1332 start_codon:yes stop_codon:yes gene_type:complete
MSDSERHVFSVSELNRAAKEILQANFPSIWIEGELSNVAKPSSGHMYFTLKDERAQVRCAMFRGHNRLLDFKPEDGSQVLAKAQVSLYENRGDYQLIVEFMEEAGDGALRRAFERLQKQLLAEGLFAEEHKQDLPELPQCIGVVTSPTGAAIRDILSTLRRRFPAIPVIIYPTAVQGIDAAGQIVNAIKLANQRKECDVLIIGRGGGSLEDLWPFNEEAVARAIYASKIPTVSAVGHEVDFTIADFVADARAATPTGAAELVSPEQGEWLRDFQRLERQLAREMLDVLEAAKQSVTWLRKRLKHPRQQLQEYAQRLDYLERQLASEQRHHLRESMSDLQTLVAQLQRHQPQHHIDNLQTRRVFLQQKLIAACQQQLNHHQQQLAKLAYGLNTMSPLATLERGYGIVTDSEGTIIRAAKRIKPGDKVTAKLAKGELHCSVNSVG